MPISFTCPHCGLKTEVADEYGGQSGPCVGCGKIVAVEPDDAAAEGADKSAVAWGPVLLVVGVLAALVGTFVCGAMFFVYSVESVQGPVTARVDTRCRNNLRRIGLAMRTYSEIHGTFPPAYVADENGKPLYSWRVLLLPYLEEAFLHEQFMLDEPWDSEHNRPLAGMMPEVYMCPADTENDGTQTSYVMIVGDDYFSEGPTGRDPLDITDGLSLTIAVVETTGSGINWAEPRDLDAEKMTFGVNDGTKGIAGNHVDGCHVLTAAGFAHLINPDGSLSSDPQAMHDLSTVEGGEYVAPGILGP